MSGQNPAGSYSLRPMAGGDVRQVVSIHLEAFPGFFLSVLGAGFLRELYRGILADPSGIALVCEDSQGLLGFVAGSDRPGGLYSRLIRRRGLQFALASVVPVVRQPKIVPRLLRALGRGKGEDVHENCATLMSVAVLPGNQGRGIGRALVLAFMDACAKRGVGRVNLLTDRDDNEAANRFYLGLGFRQAATFSTPEGRAMNEYLVELAGVSQMQEA